MSLNQNVSVLALASALAMMPVAAFAQQTTDSASTVAVDQPSGDAATSGDGEIVVTGSRIVRPNSTAAAPITSVTLQDIRNQAPLGVEEVLNRMPQIAPDNQQSYQDSDGRQRIKLRNLGFERTLVLVDGKRLGTQNGQDTGMIPVTMLDRIDLLTGGASSVYGSDAVAGVVNFILKPDFKGVRIDANYNFYNHLNRRTLATPVAEAAGFDPQLGLTNDGGRADLAVTAGTHLFSDALKISGYANYKTASLIPYASRSSTPCQLIQTGTDGPLSCSRSTYSTSGYISPRSGANSGTAFVNNPDGSRSFVPYGNGVGVGKGSNPYDGYSFQRALTRWNAGGFATLTLAPEAELYANAMWFRDRSTNRFPNRVFSATSYGSDPYLVNCDNPFLSASQATTICGAAAGTSTKAPIEVRYRFSAIPFLVDTYINQGLRLSGGLRGKVGDAWTYDVGGVYARNRQDQTGASLPDFARVNASLNVVNVNGTPTCATLATNPGCVPFDAFRAGNNNQALVDYLYQGQLGTTTGIGQLYDVVSTVTGDLGHYGIRSPLAEDGVAIALGNEYRKDIYSSTANAAYRQENGGKDFRLEQDVWEANAEIQAPLIQNRPWMHLLQANGGYRVSKYSTNPQMFNTWKLEGLVAPVEDVTFRASFNKAQRAPTVFEIRQATTINYSRQGGSQNDFCAPVARQVVDPSNPGKTITVTTPLASREVCRATGLSDALYGSPTLLCPNDQCTVRSGGFTVAPETAYTQTYGLVLKPRFLKGLVFSVDRYRIKVNNTIDYNDDSYYTNGCLRSNGDPFFCSGIVRAADGTLYAAAASNPTRGFIRAGTTNYYFLIARGWDFQSNYTLGLGGAGRLNLDFDGSLTTFAGGQGSPLQPLRNCAGYYGNGCSQLIPKWVHTLRTSWSSADNVFGASLNWRHVGSLTNADNSGDEAIGGTPSRARKTFYRVSSYDFIDLSLNFNIAEQFSLRLIANNLFDTMPPVLPNSYDISLARSNTIPQRYDSLGRQIAIGTTIRF